MFVLIHNFEERAGFALEDMANAVQNWEADTLLLSSFEPMEGLVINVGILCQAPDREAGLFNGLV
jgi:hypothetical protein